MNASECFQAGQLDDAIDAAIDEVKKDPTDLNRRGLLAELQCFAGELEKADRQLDALGTQAPESALGLALFRQLIRAEQARGQFFSEGRLPEFLTQPCKRLELHLQASIRIREGQPADAAQLLQQAEELRAPVAGTAGGKAFDDFRDLDDLTASFFEVLTSNGKYYWIPHEHVVRIEFHAPQRPRDLLWRRVQMEVLDGPDGEVFLPTLYAGTHAQSDDQLRLGRASDWQGADGECVRGVGQRMFLLGDEAEQILSLESIEFSSPVAKSDDDG